MCSIFSGGKAGDIRKYTSLCSGLSFLAAELEFGGPLSLQFFLCHKVRAPLTVAQWDKFEAMNYGRLPKNIASWEKWDRFPDLSGCFRFFSCGDSSEIEEFIAYAKEGYEILLDYDDFVWPQSLVWKLPNFFRLGCPLEGYYCWLEFVCRTNVTSSLWELEWTKTITQDDVLVGLKEFNLKTRSFSDIASVAAEAIQEWLPRDCCDLDDLYPPPTVEPECDYLFAFDEKRRQWHVRYRWGDRPNEVEEAWFDDTKDAEYVAFVLNQPHTWTPCTDILPPSKKKSRSIVGGEESTPDELEGSTGRTVRTAPDPDDREACRKSLQQIAEVEKKLAEAGRENNKEAEADYKKELKMLRKFHNVIWDKHCNRRDERDYHADTNRVRNAINHFIDRLGPAGTHPLLHLHEHLLQRKDKRKTIDLSEGMCRYDPISAPQWKVVFPPK